MAKLDNQVCLKLAGPLRAEVEADAAALQRSVSWVIRKRLIDFYVQRAAEQPKAALAA
jgi:hypothetical protein